MWHTTTHFSVMQDGRLYLFIYTGAGEDREYDHTDDLGHIEHAAGHIPDDLEAEYMGLLALWRDARRKIPC